MTDFSSYLSPFSWRYGTSAMRRLWSEQNKRLLWRHLWVVLAEVQSHHGLVTNEQVDDLRLHQSEVDIPRALEVESQIQHDLTAELRVFASQCPQGGAILHLGATSADIEDNADVLRQREALDLLLAGLLSLLRTFAMLIEKWADFPIIAYTHLQPAEPSTLGYRLALYAQDLLADYRVLVTLRRDLRGKGFKGAVGTAASYAALIGQEHLAEFESELSDILDLPFFPVASQVYPRRQDFTFISALAAMAASLHKFSFDLRLLQSPSIGELSEPFGERQVGSSAMPFKRNPVRLEKIGSLARYLAALPRIAWDDAAGSLLERTLDDSANRRILLPEACLAADEMLRTANSILARLQIDENAIKRNLELYGPFAVTEPLLAALVKAGADRQEMHEHLRGLSMQAWQAIQQNRENPLLALLTQDAITSEYLSEEALGEIADISRHIGDAPKRARSLVKEILSLEG